MLRKVCFFERSKCNNGRFPIHSQISKEWTSKEFDLLPYKGLSERTTFILGGVEEIFASLEDSLTVLNIIKSSRYVGPIRVGPLCRMESLILILSDCD